jgi:hypothetical protein
MYTITGQNHDQGRDPVTIFRSSERYVAKYVRLLGEEGYRTVSTMNVHAMKTLDDVRAFLDEIHRHEPVDWRVLEHAFEVVHARAPKPIERHPYLLLDRIRRAVVSTAAVGA